VTTSTTGVPGIRERNRAAIEAEILTVGRRHLAEVGAAALSLRAVARDLGMVPSALYRYVAGRDDLLTLLIVAAYDDLADAVDAALARQQTEQPASGPRAAFTAIATATRRWALTHPHEHALIFGSPVPGYTAPAERTTGPGTRVDAHLIALFSGLDAPPLPGVDPATQELGAASLADTLQDPMFLGANLSPTELLRGVTAWTLVLGAVSSELFEHHGPDLATDRDAHFAAVVDLAAALAFPPDSPDSQS